MARTRVAERAVRRHAPSDTRPQEDGYTKEGLFSLVCLCRRFFLAVPVNVSDRLSESIFKFCYKMHSRSNFPLRHITRCDLTPQQAV